jgi:predicted secreted protein
MSSALSSMGCTLTWDAVALAEVTNVTGPNSKVDTLDVTHYGSANNYREFIATFIDAGEVTIEGNFISGDATGQIAMITDFQARSLKEAIITLPTASATTWTFNAIITALSFAQPMDGKLGFTATLKISGAATLGLTLSAGMATCTGVEQQGGAALTFNPLFTITQFSYVVSVNTASTWVKFTPTAGSHTITITALGVTTSVASGAQSGNITLDATGTVTDIVIKVVEAAHVAKTYHVYVARPLP